MQQVTLVLSCSNVNRSVPSEHQQTTTAVCKTSTEKQQTTTGKPQNTTE